MFDYDIAGKQVVLVLDETAANRLKTLGIEGTPLFGTVLRADRKGIWLDNPAFPLCPLDKPRAKRVKGDTCRAHIFIPEDAVVSIAVFPKQVRTPERPEIRTIGFHLEASA